MSSSKQASIVSYAVNSYERMEAELEALGWRIPAAPSRTPAGWRVIGQYGSASVQLTDATKLAVLEALLRYAQKRGSSTR